METKSYTCPSCHHHWNMNPSQSDQTCLFCGEDLRPEAARKNDKPSFEFTWGLLYEEEMKKKKGASWTKVGLQALESFEKAARENPRYALYAASFLKKHAVLTHADSQARAAGILLEAWQKKNSQAGLRYLFESWQDPQSFPRQKEPVLELIRQEKDPRVLALYQALENEPKKARKTLMKSLESQALYTTDWEMLSLYTGIPAELEKRKELLENLLRRKKPESQEQAAFLLENLCRPVMEKEQAFDHQQALLEDFLPWLQEHSDLFSQTIQTFLKKKAMLRGTHLFLQLLKNQDLSSSISLEELLQLHYEQVYMQPYDWIQLTDYRLFDSADFRDCCYSSALHLKELSE